MGSYVEIYFVHKENSGVGYKTRMEINSQNV